MHARKWMNLESIMPSEGNTPDNHIQYAFYDSIYMKCPE